MPRILFVCGKNRRRSPTAEQMFAHLPSIEVASAGIDADADEVVGGELLDWADVIFVMEQSHRRKLSQRFRSHLKDQKIICLEIQDRYEYMADELKAMLRAKVLPHLGISNLDENSK